MKRIVFLIIATLLMIGLVVPGCNATPSPEEHVIKIAVCGPLTDLQGQNQWDGASIATEEINDAGGVDISGTKYTVELVKVETKETTEGEDGSTGTANLEAVIDDVDFVVGGFRLQVVQVYREVAMAAKKIFMNCGVAADALQFSIVTNYDKYKYSFKFSPYNESFIVNASFKMTGTIGQVLKATLEEHGDAVAEDYRVPEDGKLRVAILMEDLPWCVERGLVTAAQSYLPGYGFTTVGTWLVSPTATNISTELSQIVAEHPHIIFTALSGSVAAVYSIQKAELGIPAMTIGINALGEQLSHWVNTGGKCEGEIMLDTWGVGMENTETTVDWFDDYMARTGRYPVYTALTYDAIRQMCRAIAATDSLDSDTIVTWLEDPAHAMTDSVSATKVMYYPMPAVTINASTKYALSEAQVLALYDLAGYNKTYDQNQWLCMASGGAHIAHDLVYGPGYVTGVGAQWQEIGGAGAKVGIWPMQLTEPSKEYWDAALTDQYGNWNFQYPGTMPLYVPIEGFLAP
jgi:branched-chain amino acid transport system substrate-binding protein